MNVRGNRGQVLAVYAIALPALLAAFALALDGGKMFVSKVQVQNAADASALAAAQDLGPYLEGMQSQGDANDQVQQDVNCFSNHNHGPVGNCDGVLHQPGTWDMQQCTGPADTNCYTWPYVKGTAHWDQVEVRLRKPVQLEFAGLVGISNPVHARARAVATFSPAISVVTTPDTPPQTIPYTDPDTTTPGQTHTTTTVIDGTTVISTTTTPGATHTTTNITTGTCTAGSNDCGVAFAKSTECPAITYKGAGGGTIGSMMTNGGFTASGNAPKQITTLYIGKYSGHQDACFDNGGQNLVATITRGPIGPFSPQDWPLALPNQPTPVPLGQPLSGNQCWDLGTSIAGQSVGFTANTTTRPPGVYCLRGDGLLSLAKTADGYTFFAPCIGVSGNSGVYHYATTIPASQGSRQQTLFYAFGTDATCGGKVISMQGQSNSFTGDIFAPNGSISWQGGGVTGGSGFLEAQTFDIQGNFANYLGTGPLQGGSTTTVTTTDPDTTVTSTTVTGGSTTTNYTTDPDTITPGQTHTNIFPGTTGSTVTSTTSTDIGLGE